MWDGSGVEGEWEGGGKGMEGGSPHCYTCPNREKSSCSQRSL